MAGVGSIEAAAAVAKWRCVLRDSAAETATARSSDRNPAKVARGTLFYVLPGSACQTWNRVTGSPILGAGDIITSHRVE